MQDDELTREDALIHRSVDGTAGVGDWAELELLARHDPGVWRRLALAMRGELTLRRAGSAIAARFPPLPVSGRGVSARGGGRRAPILVGGLGWAAALLVGLLWAGSPFLGLGPDRAETSVSLGADAAWQQYIAAGREDGRVVRELAPLVVEALPSIDGNEIEVLFLRRSLERTTVEEVHEVTEDDAGRSSTRPIPVRRLVSNETL